jgi:hypothetical protein
MTANSALASTLRGAVVPLVLYYAITLGVPLARGTAEPSERWVEHAAFVLGVPAVLIAAWATIRALWRRGRRLW